MNILLINHYAGSPQLGMEYRPWYLAKEWVKQGHSVTIVAASFSNLRMCQPKVTRACTTSTEDGIRIVWLKTPAYTGNGVRRIANMLSFILQLYRFLPRIAKECHLNAVIASSTYPLDAYPAHWIAQKTGAQFVFELHDLWPMSPMLLGNYKPTHPFIRIMQRAENYWCRNADKVISLLSEASPHLQQHGLDPTKFFCVPNGIMPEEWANTDNILPNEYQKVLDTLHSANKFCVGYAGGHAKSNALESLLAAAQILQQKNKAVHFILLGDGTEKAHLQHMAKDFNLNNTTFLPPLPKLNVPCFLKQMDVLFAGGDRRCAPLYSSGLALNKLFDYMMASKPVILAFGDIPSIVKSSGCGYSVQCEEPESISNAILKLWNTPPEARQLMGERGKEYVLNHHAYPILAQQFMDALQINHNIVL